MSAPADPAPSGAPSQGAMLQAIAMKMAEDDSYAWDDLPDDQQQGDIDMAAWFVRMVEAAGYTVVPAAVVLPVIGPPALFAAIAAREAQA